MLLNSFSENLVAPSRRQDGARWLQWLYAMLFAVVIAGCAKSEDSLDRTELAETPADETPADQTPTPPAEDETPDPVDPDPPIDPPEVTDVQLFEQTLFPLVRDPNNFCVGCHGAQQIPTFAVADVQDAYNVITSQQKVDLATPAQLACLSAGG